MGKEHPPQRPNRHPRELPHPSAPSDWTLARALEEVAAAGGELWLVLWSGLRDVWLWAAVPAAERGELFTPPSPSLYARTLQARLEMPALTEMLGAFHSIRWSPGAVDRLRLAEACRTGYAWAEERSMIDLAAVFAEAAALADPENPDRAHLAAIASRRAAWERRAALWYERTFRLAVRAEHRDAAVGALLGYGMLLYGLGFFAQARPYLERGARRAARTGRRRKAAEAHHDLMGLSLDVEDFPGAFEHARRAEKLYPLHHRRLPALVHDFAVVLARQHHSTLAYSLIARIPSYFRPVEATLVWSTVAWAAAGAGRVERFQEAERQVLELVARHKEHAAAALLSLAEGARTLREWEKAERYATQAIELARTRSDAGQERLATALLEQVGRRRPASAESPVPEELAVFVRRLAARLRRWRPADPEAGPAGGAGGADPPTP